MRTKPPGWAWPGSRLQLIFAEKTGKADTHYPLFVSLEASIIFFAGGWGFLPLLVSLPTSVSGPVLVGLLLPVLLGEDGGRVLEDGDDVHQVLPPRDITGRLTLLVLRVFITGWLQQDLRQFSSTHRGRNVKSCVTILNISQVRSDSYSIAYNIYDIMYIYRSVAAKRSLIKDCIVRFLKTPVTFQNNRVNSVSRLYVMLTIEIIRF